MAKTSVIEEAQRRFKLFIDGDSDAIHPNLRGTVFGIVVANGGSTEYDAVVKIYRKTTVPDQKIASLAALGTTLDPALIQKTLDFAISNEVRNQDIIYVYGSVGANHKARKLLWQFTKAHWGLLEERYASSMAMLGNCVKSSTDFATEEMAKEVEEFFAVRLPLDSFGG